MGKASDWFTGKTKADANPTDRERAAADRWYAKQDSKDKRKGGK
jgi:hypothetical protein